MNQITQLLRRVADGDEKAANPLLELVYAELRRMAAGKMAGEQGGQTLQATALVHEAWLRLGGDQQPTWENRAHFFSAAAEAMRRILIERARRRSAARHGGGQARLNLDDLELGNAEPDQRMLAVNDALERLAADDPKKAELVKLRYFLGLPLTEAAQSLGISVPTATRWWAYARAWLVKEIQAERA
jgi:RNA polymerase sigma factor (TIGR02999 family)